jgi:hypothetical protein
VSFAFAQFVSSCPFLDLPSLFSTVFVDKEQIGSDERVDDEEEISNTDRMDDR